MIFPSSFQLTPGTRSRLSEWRTAEVLLRKCLIPVCVGLMLAVSSASVAAASSSPYPAKLTMKPGLLFSTTAYQPPSWGTVLTGAQARWVKFKSSGPKYRWGVWEEHGTARQFPVRSTDGGAHWKAAGPQLASDWAGGGIFYVIKVIPESPLSVVMVSNAVIDVTTDRGHQWYQYLNPASDWTMSAYAVSGGIGLRVRSTAYQAPKGSHAFYVLDVAHHTWHRTRQSLG